MLAYVLYHDESFMVHPKDPLWQHYKPFKWWLLPHGIAGASALLLGPMQFSDRLRDRFRQLHRVVGRIYVAGAFLAAPLGFYIQYFQERIDDPRSFSIAAAADAALWMITTGIALVFILKGNVQEHRRWMTRSFAVAPVFLEVRVIGGMGGWENLDVHVNETIVWVCLAFSILSADLVLQWQQLGHSASMPRRHSPASGSSMPFIDTHSLVVIERLPGWYGRYFHSQNMTFAHYDFKRDSSIHEHFHPQEEVYEVIEGELEVTIDGVARIAQPGLVAVVPSNVRHSVKALTVAEPLLSTIRKGVISSRRGRGGEH